MNKVGRSATDVATRLEHAGFKVTDVETRPPAPANSAYITATSESVLLANGLEVRCDLGGFSVVVCHGFDPVTNAYDRELYQCDSPLALVEGIRAVEPRVAEIHESLLGENRDFASEVSHYMRKWELPTPVIVADEPIDGALSIAMRGKRFSAWYAGRRYTNLGPALHQIDADSNPDQSNDRFDAASYFPFDVGGHHLTLQVRDGQHVILNGTVGTPTGDAFFLGSYVRWGSWSKAARTRSIGGVLSCEERHRITSGIARYLEPFYIANFPAFATAEVRKCEFDLESARSSAEVASTPERRTRWLRQERSYMQVLNEARAVALRGTPGPEVEISPYQFGPALVQ